MRTRLASAPSDGTGLTISLSATALVLMALSIGTSGFVFTEPAPCDVIVLVLIGLLPLAGLQRYTRELVLYLLLWLMAGIGALIASSVSTEVGRSLTHTGVSFFLYISSFVTAAFIAKNPRPHMTLILKAYVIAALMTAAAGFAGYFNVFPGAFDLFTKYGRAAGTMKDPNVYGPFLIPAILACVLEVLGYGTGRINKAWPAAIALVLTLAVLLSFSRGAWISLGASGVVFLYLLFVTVRSSGERLRLALIALGAILAAVLVVIAAMQIEAIARLLAERSSLTQGYDVGPQGRFGGHEKAKALILSNPLGIGATQFSSLYHHEDVHNVYLSMFLNAGWLGGLYYIAVLVVTVVLSLMHLTRVTETRPLFLLAFAALVGNIVEGAVIDTDHWRHFYLLLAMVWGLMAAENRIRRRGAPPALATRRLRSP